MKTLVYIITFLQLLVPCSAAIKQCYFPNGSPSSDFPCDPNAKQSACCGGGLGASCLSNKLCHSNDGNIIRGSCSDKNWSSPECANFCLSADTGGTDLISCSNVTNTDTTYCCDHTNGCCDTGAGRFNVLPKNPQVWATWNNEASVYKVVGSVFIGSPLTKSKAPTRATSTRPATTTTTKASSTNSSPSRSDRSSGLSVGAKAGIGAGVGIGVILFAVIGVLVWKLRQRKAASQDVVKAPAEELDGSGKTVMAELDARGRLNEELRPPAELSG